MARTNMTGNAKRPDGSLVPFEYVLFTEGDVDKEISTLSAEKRGKMLNQYVKNIARSNALGGGDEDTRKLKEIQKQVQRGDYSRVGELEAISKRLAVKGRKAA